MISYFVYGFIDYFIILFPPLLVKVSVFIYRTSVAFYFKINTCIYGITHIRKENNNPNECQVLSRASVRSPLTPFSV